MEDLKVQAKKIPQNQVFLFSSPTVRATVYKFATWIAQLVNTIPEDFLYLLPEAFVQIPIDVFRAFKRGKHPLYDTAEDAPELYNIYPVTESLDPSQISTNLSE